MTKKILLKEILKLERSLLRSYRALATEKYARSNQAYNLMKEIFTEIKSTGNFKTIAKSRMKKDELYNYYEQLKYIRNLQSSTVKGWREQRKQWREEAKQDGIDVDGIDENYDEWIDHIDSRPWQESASFYYDSEELNRISWLEPSEQFTELQKWLLEVEADPDVKAMMTEGNYTKISTIHNPGNTKDILNIIWDSVLMRRG